MVIDRSESLFRIKKAARLTGVDEEKLIDELRKVSKVIYGCFTKKSPLPPIM